MILEEDPSFSITVRPIANGYIVEKNTYYGSTREEWYCISPEEITEKLLKLL